MGAKAKGNIVEEIAAWLHAWPGVQVQKNALLAVRDDDTRRREIDVLLTTSVAGYQIRMAIECKNEAQPIGVPAIDAFVGKLRDVSIPPAHGIFVSASRYTSGAIRRAEKEGIRTLSLQGLSPDGLKASITGAAHQSVVFLLAAVSEVTWLSPSPDRRPPLFTDTKGRLCGTIPHLIFQKWADGSIPVRAGEYDLTLPIPQSWHPCVRSGQPIELLKDEIYAHVKVVALAFSMEGKSEEYSLIDATTKRTEKVGMRAFFEESTRRYPLTPYDSEDDLARALASNQGLRIATRIKVPRIHHASAFWPLSHRAAERIREISESIKVVDGSIPQVPLTEVEGVDIAAAWEQPMPLAELHDLVMMMRGAPAGTT